MGYRVRQLNAHDLRNRGAPAGFSRVLVPIIKPAMRRANRKDLATLKALLESRPD